MVPIAHSAIAEERRVYGNVSTATVKYPSAIGLMVTLAEKSAEKHGEQFMALTPQELVTQAKNEIKEIDVSRARKLHAQGVAFVDVREAEECAPGIIPGATCIPRGVLEFRLTEEDCLRDPEATIVVYCRSGGRSALAARSLQVLGYSNVVSLAGGYTAWIDS